MSKKNDARFAALARILSDHAVALESAEQEVADLSKTSQAIRAQHDQFETLVSRLVDELDKFEKRQGSAFGGSLLETLTPVRKHFEIPF